MKNNEDADSKRLKIILLFIDVDWQGIIIFRIIKIFLILIETPDTIILLVSFFYYYSSLYITESITNRDLYSLSITHERATFRLKKTNSARNIQIPSWYFQMLML